MITIGVIGAGYWGTNVIRTFSGIRECRLKTVADSKPGRRAFVEENFPHPEVVADHETILNDPEIDAVSIVTPVTTHFELARQALEAGKHVYVEKPFTHNSASAAKLVEIARRQNRKILVGHLFEYHPVVEKVKSLLQEERIGDIYYIDARRMNLRPPATEVNVVWDLAPHDLSILGYLLDAAPTAISAHGTAFVNPELEDSVYCHLKYGEKRFATVHLSWLTPDKTRTLAIFGSRGVIVYDDMQPVDKIRIYDEGIDSRIGAGDHSAAALAYKPGNIVIPSIPGGQPLDRECRHFLECIRDDKPIRSDGQDGYNVVRAIELVNASMGEGGAWKEF